MTGSGPKRADALACCLGLRLCLLGGAARAGEMADGARAALESDEFAAGEKKLAAALAVDPGNDEARIGVGIVRLAGAAERFGQAQNRYGLRTDAAALPLSFFLPLAPPSGLAAPAHPAQRFGYDQQRAVLQDFLDDLAHADEALAPLGDRPAKVALDLNAIQFRIAPDAPPDPRLTLGAILKAAQSATPEESARFDAVFDRADALWLRAYTHMISARVELSALRDLVQPNALRNGAAPQCRSAPELTPTLT